MTRHEVYAFGEFRLDVSERQLSRNGQPIALAPKAYDVLVALVRNARRLVGKRELLDLVWPEAFVEEGILAVHVSALRKALGDGGGGSRYIETVSRAGYRFQAAVTESGVHHEGLARRWSIAVLPVRTVGTQSSPEERSIGLAMADELIDRLGRFEQIVVRPTRAVRTYTDGCEDPVAVGRSLRVDAVVECRFLSAADQVRVSVRLVRSSDGACLWSGEFEGRPTNIPTIQEAVAESIAAQLGAGWNGAETRRDTPQPSRRPEVYELVGRGRSHLLSASLFEVPKAVAAFRAAIQLDATYAAAQAGLALACCAQAQFRVAPPEEAYSEGRAAALRALALDDSCADAQVALGAILFFSDWNWVAAERSLERALKLNPNHTEAYLLYGSLLEALGDLDRGLAMKHKALERDPFSPLVHLQIAMSYWNQRRYDDSIQWANKTLDLDPQHLLAREHLAGAYLKKGDFDRYMEEQIKHAASYGVPREALDRFEQLYRDGGRGAIVKSTIERASSPGHGFPEVQLALMHGEACDLDAAFRHLEQAIECHDPSLVYLAVGPQWDGLRADPRFNDCLGRMGLRRGF